MIDKILFWAATASSSLALVLCVTNTGLINGNMDLQASISHRQLVINTAQNVLPLNQQLSNAIYDASIKNNDEKLRTLLTSQGFTLPSKADKANAPKVAEDAQSKKSPATAVKKTSEE